MDGSTATLPELARMAWLDTSFSGMVSFAMRSLEGELLARLMSCTSQLPRQHGKDALHDDPLDGINRMQSHDLAWHTGMSKPSPVGLAHKG